MHRLLFQNRFNALAFAAIILFGVLMLVGTDNKGGALDQATQKFGTNQRAEAEPSQVQEEPRPAAMPAATSYASDEDLIDDAEGLDPSGLSSEPDIEEGTAIETEEAP